MSGVRPLALRPLLVFAALAAVGCGQNRGLPAAGPLKPEWYLIDADDRPAPGQFLRYAPAGQNGGGLDIAVTDFEPGVGTPLERGPTVHLVGVVHVADSRYYEAMQQELDGYDEVLYEGVMPAEMDGARWQRSMLETGGELGKMQQEIADWFAFRYQMEAIDYGRRNLVHADMSLEEFRVAGAERMGLVPRETDPPTSTGGTASGVSSGGGASVASVKSATDAVMSTWTTVRGLARVALGEGGPLQSLGRKLFAETMGTQDIGTSLDFVPGLSDLILTKRNDVVMKVLDVERKKVSGRLAIFYGAAHMKDLAKRLEAQGYRRTGARWMRAWVLRPPIR